MKKNFSYLYSVSYLSLYSLSALKVMRTDIKDNCWFRVSKSTSLTSQNHLYVNRIGGFIFALVVKLVKASDLGSEEYVGSTPTEGTYAGLA